MSFARFVAGISIVFSLSAIAVTSWLHYRTPADPPAMKPTNIHMEWIPPAASKPANTQGECFWLTRVDVDGRQVLTVHRACLQRAFGADTNVTLED